jgi:hypothetical protein
MLKDLSNLVRLHMLFLVIAVELTILVSRHLFSANYDPKICHVSTAP